MREPPPACAFRGLQRLGAVLGPRAGWSVEDISDRINVVAVGGMTERGIDGIRLGFTLEAGMGWEVRWAPILYGPF